MPMAPRRRMRPALSIALLALAALLGSAWYYLAPRWPAEPELPGQLRSGALQHDGLRRTYSYYLPARRQASPALVLVFHGSQGDAAQARAVYAYAFDTLAEQHGFIVVYPEGHERHFNDCRRAGPYAANTLDIDDVGFVRALVAHFAGTYGVDPAAVFATGLSNGGQMALRLALEAPELVAAVAPVAASMPVPGNLDCTPAGRPVPVLLMNGTADPMNPYNGGTVALYGLWGDRGEVLSSLDTVRYWAELAGHDGGPAEATLPDVDPGDDSTVLVRSWTAPGRAPVALYEVRGGGHGVPEPALRMPRLLGGSNRDISAAAVMWEFFRQARDSR